jgi:predicted nucleotidyltransferase
MRISLHHRQLLKDEVARTLGSGCDVLLFGSRLDDAVHGGDVDLLVRCPAPIDRKVWVAAMLAARAERLLDGRKVDVLLLDPDTPQDPVHRKALDQGLPL